MQPYSQGRFRLSIASLHDIEGEAYKAWLLSLFYLLRTATFIGLVSLQDFVILNDLFGQLNTTFFSFVPRSVSKLAALNMKLITLDSSELPKQPEQSRSIDTTHSRISSLIRLDLY
jgi:hypothetical protein